MSRLLVVLALQAILATGCASTQEIETAPPQARNGSLDDDASAAREAPLAVVITQGETPLPSDVSRLRFRVAEIRLHSRDGRWVRLPSDSAPIEFVSGGRSVRRTLLDTRVAPIVYDSMTVAFDDVFVRFGPNAGAPLTTSVDVPQRLSIALEPGAGTLTTVVLRLEPGASLTRTPDYRWFFVPMLRPDVSTRTRPPGTDPER